MSTRERILTIRLLEKISKDPMYANALGIEGVPLQVGSDGLDLFNSAESSRNQ